MKRQMKKNVKPEKFSPEEALQFLENFRQLHSEIDEPTKMISLRIPENILRSLKTTAKYKNTKYQTLVIKYIRDGLKTDLK